MTAGLSLRGLRRHFPGVSEPTLDGLDLDVPAGGSVALLGPSGSGKSTVLRLIAGLDTADGGDIRVSGRSLDGVATEHRRTALVFQQPRLFPYLDVLDNVAFPLAVAGAGRRAARSDAGRFLELVGLSALAKRRPRTLSGGQEQRVALARALAARADVLLLDEPFSALDPPVRSEMHALVNELRAAVEPTILLVTHDQHEAAILADTVGVLIDGRIAQHGPVAELYAKPANRAVHAFLGGRNALPGRVRDGAHHSALGPLALLPSGSSQDGPGTLVIRPEVMTLTPPDGLDADVSGTVCAVTPDGARVHVSVSVAGLTLTAQVSAWDAPRIGDQKGLRLPIEHRHVIQEQVPADRLGLNPAHDQEANSAIEARASPIGK